MKKIAILVCLAMIVSLFAVNVSAVETVTSTIDFRTLTPADAGDASKASMESLGAIIPEDSAAWWVQDCFHVFATPKDGYAPCSYIHMLDAGEGKVLAGDATISVGWWLAVVGDPSWMVIEYCTDGENWVELYADEAGRGVEWDASAYTEDSLLLPGTAGASKVYVKLSVNRHGGQTAGGISYSSISAVVKGVNEVYDSVDFRTLTPADAGDASKAAIESLGVVIPEGSGAWWVQDCFHVFATPKDGYSPCSFIQTLEAGEGQVFASDVSLTAGYWLAAVGDPSWFWIEISTDGENWTEAYVDEAGRGAEWDASAYTEGTISLAGTAGAEKVMVKYNVERHSGQTAGGVTYSNLSANVKAAEGGSEPIEPPVDTGDSIAAVIALLAVSGTALVVLKKKF